MSPHSLFGSSSHSGSLSTMTMPTPPQHSPSAASSSTPFSIHRQPLLAQEMKKARNSKRLSLMVVPPPSFEQENNTQNHNNNSHLHRMTPTTTTFNNTIGNNTNSSSSTCSNSSYKSKIPSSLSLPIIVTPSPSFPPMTSSLSSRRAFTPAPLSSNSLKVSASPATPSLLQPLSKRNSQLSLEEALPSPRFPLAIHSTIATSSSSSLSPPTGPTRSALPSNGGPRTISAYFSDYSIECGAASPYVSEPVMVLPNLYLGAEHNATDLNTLKRLGITFVLNVAIEIAKDNDNHNNSNSNINGSATPVNKQCDGLREGIEYKSLAWTHHQRNLLRDFPTAFRMMDEATMGSKEGGKVLVHCQLGVSRSASLVIACVMRSQGMGLSEAYDFVKTKSGVISPNMSLMYQLAEFEKDLQRKKKMASSCTSSSVSSSSTTPINMSTADTMSTGSRNSWSSQMEDDDDEEPPYPFAAAFSSQDSGDLYSTPMLKDTVVTSMPIEMATTPVRQEFHKRPLTPDEHGRDEYPNNKPFQSANSSPAHRLSSHPRLSASPTSASRRWSVGHSPLSKVSSPPSSPPSPPQRQCTALSLSPKTPTTEQFSTMCLSNEEEFMMMIPETPSFLQTTFSVPPLLSSSCSSSSASSVSSFEACSRPSSMNSTTTSSHCSFFTACEDDDEEEQQQSQAESSGPSLFSPRNSWNLAPVPKSSSGGSSDSAQQQQKKKRRNLWSGLQTMQVLAEGAAAAAAASTSSSRTFMEKDGDEKDVVVGRRQNDKEMMFSLANNINNNSSSSKSAAVTIHSRKLAAVSKRTRPAPRLTLPLPDFIFSPRPYDTPAAQAASTTRSFGDVYQALFTTDSDMLS
ncbi:hypothetical protein EMPS_10198 [Entomortierella parvispora]|uniref:protein-tyrosine-phosphatase n=1 Tax=Entomortierella parvispora TaxID=205924 RepID=A0A9P3HJD8_9FUNG|nr:hypothetical protein EMPS_10198 [Entomortierella parvispora]